MKRITILLLLLLPLATVAQNIKFDSLNDEFFRSWERLSAEYAAQSSADARLDSICQRLFYHFYDTTGKAKYLVLPAEVRIRVFDSSVMEKFDGDRHYYDHYNYGEKERWRFVEERIHVPHIEAEKSILYDIDFIHEQLEHYIGGYIMITQEVKERVRKYVEIDKARETELARFIPVAWAHSGYYWHFASMPMIEIIDVYQNGVVVHIRYSWCTGEACYVPFDSGEIITLEEWIE